MTTFQTHRNRTRRFGRVAVTALAVAALGGTGPASAIAKAGERPKPPQQHPGGGHQRSPQTTLELVRTSREPVAPVAAGS
jgi:hypothetical protein